MCGGWGVGWGGCDAVRKSKLEFTKVVSPVRMVVDLSSISGPVNTLLMNRAKRTVFSGHMRTVKVRQRSWAHMSEGTFFDVPTNMIMDFVISAVSNDSISSQ